MLGMKFGGMDISYFDVIIETKISAVESNI